MADNDRQQQLESEGYIFDTGRLDGGIIYEDVTRFPVISNDACAISRKLSEAHAANREKVGLLYIVGNNINIAYNPSEYAENGPASYLVTRLAYLADPGCLYFWERMVKNLDFPVTWKVFSDRDQALSWLDERNWPPSHGGSKTE